MNFNFKPTIAKSQVQIALFFFIVFWYIVWGCKGRIYVLYIYLYGAYKLIDKI